MEDHAERRRFALGLAPGDDVRGGDPADQGPTQQEALDGGQAEPEQGSQAPARAGPARRRRGGLARARPVAQAPTPSQPSQGSASPGSREALHLDPFDPQAEPRQLVGRDRRGLALALGPGRAGEGERPGPLRPPAPCRTSFPWSPSSHHPVLGGDAVTPTIHSNRPRGEPPRWPGGLTFGVLDALPTLGLR